MQVAPMTAIPCPDCGEDLAHPHVLGAHLPACGRDSGLISPGAAGTASKIAVLLRPYVETGEKK